jgi:tripartite-type tricarboxylate transporter receptor subunit TctC
VIGRADFLLDLNHWPPDTVADPQETTSTMKTEPSRRQALIQAGAWLSAACLPWPARSQDFSARPITLVVPSQAGGGTDATARTLAVELGKKLGQTVVVDDMPGASGAIGAQKVLHASPDGYTLLLANSDLVLASIVHRNAGYSLSDFAPIVRLGSAPMTLVARRDFPAASVDEMVALAKARPGKISVGVSGPATIPALAVAMLEQSAQIELLKVPYKGAAQVVNDVLAGQVDLAVSAVSNTLGPAGAGTIKVLGVLSSDRVAMAPELPLVGESSSARKVALDIWVGLFGPARMPAAAVNAINAAVQEVLRDPGYRAKQASGGVIVAEPATADAFARQVAAEADRFRAAAVRLASE